MVTREEKDAAIEKARQEKLAEKRARAAEFASLSPEERRARQETLETKKGSKTLTKAERRAAEFERFGMKELEQFAFQSTGDSFSLVEWQGSLWVMGEWGANYNYLNRWLSARKAFVNWSRSTTHPECHQTLVPFFYKLEDEDYSGYYFE